MNLVQVAPQWLLILLALVLVAAAIQDSVRLKISNYLVLAVLAGAIVAAVMAGPRLDLWENLVVFAGLLTLGTFAFSAGIMGGGDVKLLAASALWYDFSGSLRLIPAVFVAGGLLSFLILIVRRSPLGHRDARWIILRPRGGIPYGIAIAAGMLFTIGTKLIPSLI